MARLGLGHLPFRLWRMAKRLLPLLLPLLPLPLLPLLLLLLLPL